MLMLLAVSLLALATAQNNNSVRGKYHGDVKQFDIEFRARHFLEQEFYLALKFH
jgi:hypothetical protein